MLIIWLDNDDNMQYLIRTYLEVKFGSFVKGTAYRFNSSTTVNKYRAEYFYTESLKRYDRVMLVDVESRDGQVTKLIAKRIVEKTHLEIFYPTKQQKGWPPISCLRQRLTSVKDVVSAV